MAIEQTTLAAAFGLKLTQSPPWVDPVATRHLLAEWEAMDHPPDVWPITLYRGSDPVEFAGPAELEAATKTEEKS